MPRLAGIVLLSMGLAACGDDPCCEAAGAAYVNSGEIVPEGLPFSEAVRVGGMLYLSGQVGVVPGTLNLAEGGLVEEAHQAMRNIKTVLESQGMDLGNLVRCTIMLADIADWPQFNEVYAAYFDGDYPARSAFGDVGLALGARVEVECLAVAGP